MPWPSGNVSTANLDSAADSISSAREDLYTAVTKLNEIIQTGGITGNIISNVSSVNGQVGVVVLTTANISESGTSYYYTEERSQDSTANLFANGTHTGITFTYNDSTGAISANITGNIGTYVSIAGTETITGAKTFSANTSFTGYTTLNEYIEVVYSGGNVSGSYTPDAANGPVHKITATGNFTLNAPTNMVSGSSITIIIRQDATGSRIMTANAAYKFAAGINILSTAASSIDILSIFYDGTNYLTTLSKGYV